MLIVLALGHRIHACLLPLVLLSSRKARKVADHSVLRLLKLRRIQKLELTRDLRVSVLQHHAALLERGLGLLADETERLGDGQALPGDVAFKLYDTFGFPLDLTQDALRERGRGVDTEGFEAAMQVQRTRARAAWSGSGDAATEQVWFELRERIGASEFLGYSTEQADAEITALVVAGTPVDEAAAGTEVLVLLNQTPFYAESGGQVGDTGVISGPGFVVTVTDTQKKLGELFAHVGRVDSGIARVGAAVTAIVDHARRSDIRAHHSATHLLHEALRRRLGTHVTQKGSLNAPDRLRFDVSQPRPVTAEELSLVEAEVNEKIRENAAVTTRLMTPEQAVAQGAMALFGEKYGDEVRVVSMGEAADDGRPAYSIELCGGTHVRRTGDIGLFRITSEAGVSAGVRRIEAVTGRAAEQAALLSESRLNQVAGLLRVPAAEAVDRLTVVLEERRALERQISELQRKLATGGAGASAVEQVDGIAFAGRNLGEVSPRELKGLAEEIGTQMGSGVVALISTADGKASVVAWVSPDLVARLDAVLLVREASAAMGGKGGGGRRELAQAGGPEAGRADEALAAIRAAIAQAAAG